MNGIEIVIPTKYIKGIMPNKMYISATELNKLYHLYVRCFITLDELYYRIIRISKTA